MIEYERLGQPPGCVRTTRSSSTLLSCVPPPTAPPLGGFGVCERARRHGKKERLPDGGSDRERGIACGYGTCLGLTYSAEADHAAAASLAWT